MKRAASGGRLHRLVRVALAVGASGASIAPAHATHASGLTMDQAVGVALQRNRDVIAARLEIEAAQLDVVAARIYPNPVFAYSVGNLVLGSGNEQGRVPAVQPGFFAQPVQSLGISEIIDVWAKRSARTRVADRAVRLRRYLTEDVLREIVYAVRSAFAEVAREQSEHELALETSGRYAETVRLSRARYRAGDISETELRKVELEGIRYRNAVVDAEMQLDLGRQRLAQLMGLNEPAQLTVTAVIEAPRPAFDAVRDPARLLAAALSQRPDLRAAQSARDVGEAQLVASRREVLPDIVVGGSYTRSDFTVAGDNPQTLGLSLSVPLPLFDRNQANIGRARLDIRRSENDAERLKLVIQHEVAEALRRAARARALLQVFEGPTSEPGTDGTGAASQQRSAGGSGGASGASIKSAEPGENGGGMLARAETALRVAERSYQVGAISLLELLEAQRTSLETRGQYLRVVNDYAQAAIDVSHAVGEPMNSATPALEGAGSTEVQ